MFSEDLTVFFDLGAFGVNATWTPSSGGAQQSATVILDAPDLTILGDVAISRNYEMLYPAGAFTGLDYGETVTVDGHAYSVQDVLAIDDGALMKARLTKQ